ncbi:hypothetical protein BDA99DRAFT_541402 [Phascolomyces articulosus]|uniref:Uncharacterized protein n=1 Tax=Phascolomyces articulosus TaxID=60185 RepID=A0AAD5K1U9_9FUNG|nr:hypothetical protein BDA99DRAFT_541402 [Phascolomyces articulosus]
MYVFLVFSDASTFKAAEHQQRYFHLILRCMFLVACNLDSENHEHDRINNKFYDSNTFEMINQETPRSLPPNKIKDNVISTRTFMENGHLIWTIIKINNHSGHLKHIPVGKFFIMMQKYCIILPRPAGTRIGENSSLLGKCPKNKRSIIIAKGFYIIKPVSDKVYQTFLVEHCDHLTRSDPGAKEEHEQLLLVIYIYGCERGYGGY